MTAESGFDLHDASLNGVYFVDDEDIEPIAEAAIAAALCVARLDLADCRDKTDLLQRLADALHFPAWFGHNWDALDDALHDLSWLPASGYVLLFEHADTLRDAAEDDFETLLDILADATDDAADDGLPWHVFFALPEDEFDNTTPA